VVDRLCITGYEEEAHGGDKYYCGKKGADSDSLSIVCFAVVDGAKFTSFAGIFIIGVGM
jgi:hypothetical protein